MSKNSPTILAIVLSVALLGAKCSHVPQWPKGEDCLIGKTGCVCFDPTKPKDEQTYILPFDKCINYIAMAAERFMKIQELYIRNCSK